jgi:nicotinamidase-related amidase/type 1 glutamine amidotransferase
MRACFAALALVAVASHLSAADEQITVHKRSRVADGAAYRVQESLESWQARQTAIIVCDMWDSHHCLNAVRRAVEMAPRMNAVLETARQQGVTIIHAPSGCMEPYASHPGRKLAQSAPKAANLPEGIGEWCRHIPEEDKGTYPIDQTDGGEDDDPNEHKLWHEKLAALGRNPKAPWKAQLALLRIDDADAISDSGVEIWNLLESRGIRNVVLVGVHTNMCVLGRPFGLRQLSKNGKNVVLMRDMTDTMYNPARAPYVDHFAGTDLIVEHIEKFVCPTITSVDFLGQKVTGGKPFQFARRNRNVAMLIGDDEYKTEISLPALVASDLKPLGFAVTIIHSDPQEKHCFPGMAEAIRASDLVLVSVRRRLPPKADLDALREHIAAGKPLVGIRTACHAWSLRNDKETEALAAQGHAAWPEFDPEVFGGHYTGHHGNGPKTEISLAPHAAEHAILRGVDAASLVGNGSLYKVMPLAQGTTPLLIGAIPGQDPEPVAWTNHAGPKRARVFFTSLGHIDDFQNPAFRKLLVNGLFWALEEPYPKNEDIDRLLPAAVR